jgi:hypothetical protein
LSGSTSTGTAGIEVAVSLPAETCAVIWPWEAVPSACASKPNVALSPGFRPRSVVQRSSPGADSHRSAGPEEATMFHGGWLLAEWGDAPPIALVPENRAVMPGGSDSTVVTGADPAVPLFCTVIGSGTEAPPAMSLIGVPGPDALSRGAAGGGGADAGRGSAGGETGTGSVVGFGGTGAGGAVGGAGTGGGGDSAAGCGGSPPPAVIPTAMATTSAAADAVVVANCRGSELAAVPDDAATPATAPVADPAAPEEAAAR